MAEIDLIGIKVYINRYIYINKCGYQHAHTMSV